MRIPLAHLFARNPLSGVSTLMDRVVECSDQVPTMIDHLVAGKHAEVQKLAKEISRLEGEADASKNEIRSGMPMRLMFPVDRRDVLRLISQIDAIADSAEDVGVLLTFREMTVPEPMQAPLKEMVKQVIDAVHTAHRLVETLASLQSSAFTGKAAERAQTIIEELARQEHEADKVQDRLVKLLFDHEDSMKPLAVLMWMKILEEIGDMADHAENVGDQFRLFIAR